MQIVSAVNVRTSRIKIKKAIFQTVRWFFNIGYTGQQFEIFRLKTAGLCAKTSSIA